MSEANGLSVLKIDIEPVRLLVTSEPYVVATARGYQAVVNVFERRSRREYLIYIGAISLTTALEQLRRENAGSLVGVEFWLRKEDSSRYSRYVVEE